MIQISIHTLPHEIDQLEQTLIQLKRNSIKFESTHDKFLIDVVLNLNLVNWNDSLIPKQFFIDKFHNLEILTKTWAQTQFEIDEKNEILGCVSHRRRVFNETKADSIIMLDTDIIFTENLLYYIYYSNEQLKLTEENYILTPQIPNMWDNSWDCIVNEKYIGKNSRDYESRDPYLHNNTLGEISIKPINNFKFGGGWFTLISTPLAKLISIPESLGHYGLEDTYVMICAQYLKQTGVRVNQYVIENEIIAEDHLFRFNPYKSYIVVNDKMKEFRQDATNNFQKEIEKFIIKNS